MPLAAIGALVAGLSTAASTGYAIYSGTGKQSIPGPKDPYTTAQGITIYPGSLPPGYSKLTPQEKAYNDLQVTTANKIAESEVNASTVQANASFTQSLDLRNALTFGGIILAILVAYFFLKKRKI